MLRLKEKYKKEVIKEMMKRFGLKSEMAAPRVEKVVLNIGLGKMLSGKGTKEREKALEPIVKTLAMISGQQPILTESHRSIAGFKVRAGSIVGAKVTLRGSRAYDFLERFINIALPRSRDFRGLEEKSVDRNGVLTIGIREHIIFPEVSAERAQDIFSFEVTIKTTAKNREQAMTLFRLIGFPLKVVKEKE